jgi:hypothetical protein
VGRGFVLAAGEVGVLDLLARLLVAEPREDVLVEVAVAGAHPADVQGERGPEEVGARLDVVADDRGHHAGDIEVVDGVDVVAVTAAEPLREGGAVEGVGLG